MATEITNTTSPEVHHDNPKKDTDVESTHVERMEYGGKDITDFNQVDKEVAKYTSDVRIDIDEATNNRLKKMINRRVLFIMIFTYFLQALDKGTLSFASIMGIQKDAGLVGQQVCIPLSILPFQDSGKSWEGIWAD